MENPNERFLNNLSPGEAEDLKEAEQNLGSPDYGAAGNEVDAELAMDGDILSHDIHDAPAGMQ